MSIEIVDANGQVFREFPVNARDGALRSYLQAEKGARYQVRVRNTTGERLGLVIAVDGRNIINGAKSDLARSEPMYVLDAWGTQDYAGWRANLDAINEFYFTDWSDSYAEAFGDRSARGVIAVAVYGEVPPPRPVYQPYDERERSADSAGSPAASAPPSARSDDVRKSPPRAAGNPPVPVMAIAASIMPCRWNSSRAGTPTAVISSSTNGGKRCAASISSTAARRIVSG